MNFYEKLVALSFELYDINSNLSMNVHTDMIDIMDGNRIIMTIWVQDGNLYPTISEHHTNKSIAININEVLNILKAIDGLQDGYGRR